MHLEEEAAGTGLDFGPKEIDQVQCLLAGVMAQRAIKAK